MLWTDISKSLGDVNLHRDGFCGGFSVFGYNHLMHLSTDLCLRRPCFFGVCDNSDWFTRNSSFSFYSRPFFLCFCLSIFIKLELTFQVETVKTNWFIASHPFTEPWANLLPYDSPYIYNVDFVCFLHHLDFHCKLNCNIHHIYFQTGIFLVS